MEDPFSIEQLWMPAFTTTTSGRIVSWNKGLEDSLGYSSSEIRGKHCYHILCEKEASGSPCCQKACRLRRVIFLDTSVKGPPLWLQGKPRSQALLPKYSVVPLDRSKRRKEVQMLHLLQPAKTHREMKKALDSLQRTPFSRAGDALLSLREREVLRLLCEGYRTAEISETLFISIHTVRSHLQHIFRKMGVHDKLQAILHARKQELL